MCFGQSLSLSWSAVTKPQTAFAINDGEQNIQSDLKKKTVKKLKITPGQTPSLVYQR